jgi:hypothetical protein
MATTTNTHNTYIGTQKSVDVTFSEMNTLANSAPETVTNVAVPGAMPGMIPVISFVNALDSGVTVKQPPIVNAVNQIAIYLYNELTTKITPAANSVHVRLL